MNVIFTYCTLNNCSEFDEFFTKMARVAIATAKRNIVNAKVIVYCDKESYEHFKTFKYIDDIVIVDYKSFDRTFWCFPKIVSYNMQEEEFVHIDLDIAILSKIDFSNKEFISERIRKFDKSTNELRFLDQSMKVPDILYCSGIFGGNRLEYFKEMYSLAYKEKDTEFTYEDLYSLEELNVTQKLIRDKVTVFNPSQKSFIHFWARPKEQYADAVDVLSHMYMI